MPIVLPKIAKPAGIATTQVEQTIQGKTVAQDQTHEVVQVPGASDVVEDASVSVGIGLGYTKNLGDQNFFKVNVDLRVPCKPEELEQTYGFILDWVNKKLMDAIADPAS